MPAYDSITPTTQILDAAGYDWAWAFVVYRPIPDFPDYCAGTNGLIWSRKQFGHWTTYPDYRRRLNPREGRDQHFYVTLRRDGGHFSRSVHRLVLETFIGARPPGMEGCHFPDHDPANNSIYNLRWGTPGDNTRDSYIQGRVPFGNRRPVARLTPDDIPQIRAMRLRGMTHSAIAGKYSVDRKTISAVLSGKNWSYVPS